MSREEVLDLKKYVQKVRKLFNQISKDCNKYVDEFDTINYSLNKMQNIIAKVSLTPIRENQVAKPKSRQFKPLRPKMDNESSASSQDQLKVKAIIEDCRTTTDTLSRKIKVLCNLPTNPKTKQYKQFLKHSQSTNPRGINLKRQLKSSRHKPRQKGSDQQDDKRVIKQLDLDIRKLTKQLEAEIKNKG